ncbi:hypothetical protein ACI3L1_02785 [Deinococcus sp. SM5_A1]|uniref:hypothetical protein n=1 Tax=Deinococcus sp. SM5_A1 TaxID=3379094 RepID=UPI003858B675
MALFLAGWFLGWLAVGERRWAVVPALATLLAVLGGVFQLFSPDTSGYSTDLTRAVLIPFLGIVGLWGISRLPSLPWRIGLATASVPLMVAMCFVQGGLLFLGIFRIP